MDKPAEIKPATVKLGVLLPGMGAVGTTFVAGCLLARRGLAPQHGVPGTGTIGIVGRCGRRGYLSRTQANALVA